MICTTRDVAEWILCRGTPPVYPCHVLEIYRGPWQRLTPITRAQPVCYKKSSGVDLFCSGWSYKMSRQRKLPSSTSLERGLRSTLFLTSYYSCSACKVRFRTFEYSLTDDVFQFWRAWETVWDKRTRETRDSIWLGPMRSPWWWTLILGKPTPQLIITLPHTLIVNWKRSRKKFPGWREKQNWWTVTCFIMIYTNSTSSN